MTNEINKQYFSGNQASLFIGDLWVDDITSFNYSVQHGRVPQYGYGSQHFDFLPKGNMLITGSFSINFREPNYLWLILDRQKNFNESRTSRIEKARKAESKIRAQTYEGDVRKRFDEFFQNPNADTARESLLEQSREFNGVSENNTRENFNHSAFSILVGYGSELGSDSPGETIEGVSIMGKSKIVNIDGRPIQEEYSFIARKLV